MVQRFLHDACCVKKSPLRNTKYEGRCGLSTHPTQFLWVYAGCVDRHRALLGADDEVHLLFQADSQRALAMSGRKNGMIRRHLRSRGTCVFKEIGGDWVWEAWVSPITSLHITYFLLNDTLTQHEVRKK